VVDIAKETHQALNANDPAAYEIAQERAMLAQEMFLFENSGSEDLERVVDPQFQKARYSALARFRDGNLVARVIHEMARDLPAILGPEITWSITGSSSLIARTVEATTASLVRTYALALAVITPLMMLLIGSLRAGLVSMAPNLLPILLTLAIMPLLQVPLDLFTMMLGCIAIGLAVDDTLHFIHGFRSRYAETGDPYQAIEQTLNTTGRALLFTSIVLCSGFLVLTLSSMSNLQALGALTAFAIGAAFILDIIVTPALLILVYPKRDT
jgi:predicted RND superfamily exporter protein